MIKQAWLPLVLCSLVSLTPAGAAQADWRIDALKSEANYIVDSSFTLEARNRGQVEMTDDAYGALNNVRIGKGPDWVRPGEGAMAIIGLMAATAKLKELGEPVDSYLTVIDAFFGKWLLKRQAICSDKSDPCYGGFAQRVLYNEDGSLKEPAKDFNSGTTGAMMCAMGNYYRFNLRLARDDTTFEWSHGPALQIAIDAGEFLKRCVNEKYQLVGPSPKGGNLWINDSCLAAAGLRAVEPWRLVVDEKYSKKDLWGEFLTLGFKIGKAIEAFKDPSGPGFFKFLNPADGSRGNDGSIDQLCFVPFETDVLKPGDPYAKAISNFATRGPADRRLTYQVSDAKSWTYFGTRWHVYEKPNPETDRLTPGAGLQLAKVEWKYAKATGDKGLRQRALRRYEFVKSTARSNLWFGADGRTEAGVPGGIVDWRLASQNDNKSRNDKFRAPEWQRFIDTSAYFIEVTLMMGYDVDTKYTAF